VKYQHRFHAGNFADVHKHVTLLALLRAMQRKEKGLFYLDTHAGRGRYVFTGAEPRAGIEARGGFELLRDASVQSEELRDYVRAQFELRDAANGSRGYAGSALLAAHALRAQDRGVCCEIEPAESRALQRVLQSWPRMRAQCADGLQAASAWLPPQEKRALLLIDPPYENPDAEFAAALQATGAALQRLAGAVIAWWYPIKDERTLAPWLQSVTEQVSRPVLRTELWIHPRDSRVALNGSGLLIVNPPFQFDARLAQWLPELGSCLGTEAHGGTSVQWLVHEH
jgi:23S rRNA (adenine2030-N6)-methyltransferase